MLAHRGQSLKDVADRLPCASLTAGRITGLYSAVKVCNRTQSIVAARSKRVHADARALQASGNPRSRFLVKCVTKSPGCRPYHAGFNYANPAIPKEGIIGYRRGRVVPGMGIFQAADSVLILLR
jgi:hypothetical protein